MLTFIGGLQFLVSIRESVLVAHGFQHGFIAKDLAELFSLGGPASGWVSFGGKY